MSDVTRGLRGVTLRQLRIFQAVARLHSFTAAARELHVTQPAISMQIRELEEACGNALYDRIGRRVQLTAASEELAACAQAILQLLTDTHARLDALAGLRAGTLKLGAISTAKYFTPALLAAFRAHHPDIAIQFKVGNREDIVENFLPARGLGVLLEARAQRQLLAHHLPLHYPNIRKIRSSTYEEVP